MLKSNKGKSTARRPLIDKSNGRKAARIPDKKHPADGDNDAALDRLLLVRSELSNLFSEVRKADIFKLEPWVIKVLGRANKVNYLFDFLEIY